MNSTLSPAEKTAKKEKQAREGEANMARYREQKQQTLDRTARLRAQRLVRVQEVSKPDARGEQSLEHQDGEPRRTLSGLHQGVRG
jgi:cytoplasmic iron level regulating protein YaaA (DUF328/UPF0246 family)